MNDQNNGVVSAKLSLDVSKIKAQLDELEAQADRVLAKAREAKELMK